MFSRAGWATLSIPLLAGLVRTQRDTETERERDGRKQQGFHPPHKYIVLKGRGGGRGNYARSWTKIHQNKKADEERKKNLHVRSF